MILNFLVLTKRGRLKNKFSHTTIAYKMLLSTLLLLLIIIIFYEHCHESVTKDFEMNKIIEKKIDRDGVR